MSNVEFAVRSLRRAPSFTLLVIATLALGIGANTAMFSIVNAVLLQPFPYPDAHAILRIRAGTSLPDLRDLAEQTHSFSSLAAYRAQMFDHADGGEAERVDGVLVTGRALALFGASTLAGRLITSNDDRVGAAPVVVVSSRFWRTRLGSAPDVIGHPITLSGQSYTVVGILAPGFSLPATRAEVVAPFTPAVGREATARGAHTLQAFVRLADGVTPDAAQKEVEAVAIRLEREYPRTNTGQRFLLQPLRDSIAGETRRPLLLLLWSVGFVLLIACVNVANLLFARVSGRRQELAVRAAIGATRSHLIRQLLTEAMLLAISGGVLGVVSAAWLTHSIVTLAPAATPRLDGVAIDGRVLLFATAVSVFAGVLFGILPAWTGASESIAEAARAGSRGSRRGNRARAALLVVEVALSCVLLVGAALLFRSFSALLSQPLGFDSSHVLTGNVTLNGARYASPASRAAFWQQVEDRIRAIPGVDDVALTTDLPIGGSPIFHNLVFEGKPAAPGTEPEVYYRSINNGFFAALRIPVLKGRTFTATDREGGAPVAVVNGAFAHTYFPGEDVLGRRIRWASGDGTWITIVGVVADVRGLSLDLDEVPAVYGPITQETQPWRRWMDVAVRTNGDAGALAPALRAAVAAVDRNVPLARVRSMDDVIAASLEDRRFSLTLLGGFAAISLLLAAAGTYGVMTGFVQQRAREVGVRLALGATRGDVFALIVGRGAALAALGVAIGAPSAFALTRVLQSMLFGVTRLDAAAYATAAGVLLSSVLAATYWPARRAVRIDPLVALRSE